MKRGVEAREARRHPFYRDEQGRHRVDPDVAALPEFEPLWAALYAHYERGEQAPLPYDRFPLARLPSELMSQIVRGDPQTFFHLLAVEPAMAPHLRAMAPQLVHDAFPDAFMLLMLAIDRDLVEGIDALNAALATHGDGFTSVMGATNQNEITEPFARESLLALRDGDTGLLASQWQVSSQGFRRSPGEKCLLSHVHAIRIAACVIRVGVSLGLEWQKGGLGAPRAFTRWEWRRATPVGGYSNLDFLLVFVRNLIAALHNEARPDAKYTFTGIRADGFSEEAAELNARIRDYEHDMAFWRRELGTERPRYIDAQFLGRTVSDVCVLARYRDCDDYWIRMLRALWSRKSPQASKALEVPRGPYLEDESSDLVDESSSESIDAHCRSCGALATQRDKHTQLPLCSAECRLRLFDQLQAYGLLSQ